MRSPQTNGSYFYGSVLGIAASVYFNMRFEAGIGASWWHGVVFAVSLVLLVPLAIKVSLFASMGLTAGLVVGGTVAVVVTIVNGNWAYLAGSLLTCLISVFFFQAQRQALASLGDRSR
jgi:hypothetical protein